MKKYCIPIGDPTPENEKLLNDVMAELVKVGFRKIPRRYHWRCIEVCENGYVGHLSQIDHRFRSHELIQPELVLKFAAELEGAKKPWEIPPEGYRLVTEEERNKYMKCCAPKTLIAICKAWETPRWTNNICRNSEWWSHSVYAVPLYYKFESVSADVAPNGFRIVSTKERLASKYPDCKVMYSYGKNWLISETNYCWDAKTSIVKAWAIPEECKLEPKVVEITAHEAQKMITEMMKGKQVKIVM